MFLAACPAQIRDVKLTNSTAGGFNGNLLFLQREPESGFVSKQYCVVKDQSSKRETDRAPSCCPIDSQYFDHISDGLQL